MLKTVNFFFMPRMVIIGAGRLAQALAGWARLGGYELAAVVSRDPRRARAAARRLHARQGLALGQPLPPAELYWLAISDDALAGVARQLARSHVNWRGRVVLHSSGLCASTVLQPLARRGAATGSLHPLMSFAQGVRVQPQGVLFAFEGSPAARRLARRLIRHWKGEWLELSAAAKPAYHLAASLATPGLVVLAAAAQAAGLRRLSPPYRRKLRQGLMALLAQTARNLARPGSLPKEAWTGPLSRGDRRTLRAHRVAARKLGLADYYRAQLRLARRLLP